MASRYVHLSPWKARSTDSCLVRNKKEEKKERKIKDHLWMIATTFSRHTLVFGWPVRCLVVFYCFLWNNDPYSLLLILQALSSTLTATSLSHVRRTKNAPLQAVEAHLFYSPSGFNETVAVFFFVILKAVMQPWRAYFLQVVSNLLQVI